MHSVKGNWRQGSFTWDPEDNVQGSGEGHLSVGALLGNLEGDSFTRDFERWMTWGPTGETRGGLSTRNFGNSLKVSSGYGASLSMGALLGEPERGVPLLVASKVMKGGLWGWVSLFMGAQLGNLERAHLRGTLRYG